MTRVLEMLLMTLGGIWQGARQDFNLFEIALVALGFWLWKLGRLPRFEFKKGADRSVHLERYPPNQQLRIGERIVWPLLKHRQAVKPWVLALAIAAGTIAVRLTLLPFLHAPVPVVSDEFSHLLLADTLAHGRVANPTHPFWQHFETLHVIQQPHYGSDYFPGQAAVLAAARVAIGSAWAGVLAECFGFLIALYWMLRGWMPARWALSGVALAALRFGIGSYWVNAFHGGFLPAIGGALIAGAFPRLIGVGEKARWGASAVFGIGLAILATTRPFEGALYSLPWVVMLAWKLRWRMIQPAIPAVIIAGAAVVAMGMYFERVTGSPFVTAYQVNQKAYGWPMGLAWTKPPKIEFRHVELERYYNYELGEREKVDGPLDFVEFLAFRVQEYWRFFLGPVLTVPLIMLARVWRRRRMLILGMSGAVVAILLEGAASPHYLAPAAAVIVAIIIECCRYFHARRIPMIPLAMAVMTVVLGLRIAAQDFGLPYTQELNYQSWCCKVQGNMNKARVTRTLERAPGRHLVFVKTKTDEYNLLQWVYNAADIDGSRIVWARDLGAEKDAKLMKYFRDRDVWMVDPNCEPAGLERYATVTAQAPAASAASSSSPD